MWKWILVLGGVAVPLGFLATLVRWWWRRPRLRVRVLREDMADVVKVYNPGAEPLYLEEVGVLMPFWCSQHTKALERFDPPERLEARRARRFPIDSIDDVFDISVALAVQRDRPLPSFLDDRRQKFVVQVLQKAATRLIDVFCGRSLSRRMIAYASDAGGKEYYSGNALARLLKVGYIRPKDRDA